MRGREPVAWVAPRWRLMHLFYSEGMRSLMGKVLNILSVSKSSKFLIYWQENMHNFILVDDLPFLICFFFFPLPSFFFFLPSLSGHGGEWEHENSHSLCIKTTPHIAVLRVCEPTSSVSVACCILKPPPHKTTHQPQKNTHHLCTSIDVILST